ncbi:Cytochrome c-550 [Methylobrevis pamukkalensis]|uniref:Cytochrome c-550 n=1 Tax=Methylobrevis pamukkalensis TaxID=1439726 RepID=A0A1E3GUV1_9HYPH|nr:Cytochrome c-550 [Methylobrevis pamukkalensis]
MDSFELNKIAGTVLGTLLFAMGLGFVAEGIFHMEAPEKAGYEIAVAEDTGAAPAEEVAAVPLGQLLASADAGKGEAVAKKCVACHSFEKGGPNKTGPDLWGVVERKPGGHEASSIPPRWSPSAKPTPGPTRISIISSPTPRASSLERPWALPV